MEKKHIKGGRLRRDLLSQIRNRINNGEERQTIFDDLSSKFIERDYIAAFIARVPSPDDEEDIKKLNSLLVIIIFVWAGIKLLTNLTIFVPIILKDYKFMIALPLVFLLPAVAFWLAFQIRRYDGLFYRIIGLLSIVGICKELQGLIDVQPGNIISYGYFLIIISLLIVASVISFKIKKRFFPHLAFSGAKKEGGNFILGRK